VKSIIDKYTYQVEWSEEDGVHIARCLELPSLTAHDKTPELALKQIKIVVKETIKWMKQENERIPEPFGLKKFKGNLTLRTSSELHRKIAIIAAEQGVSINQFILSRLGMLT
jgi:predicted RNase H-like HicB family nuclease